MQSHESRPDPFNLIRFVRAQDGTWDAALAELQRGRKTSHWMWYVFPQVEGLGSSAMSRRYAIRSSDETRAYLAHGVLGPRLIACCDTLLALSGLSAHEIFGSPDDMKLQSCATLFAHVSPAASAFHRVLDRYFNGQPDAVTLPLLGA